MIWLFVNDIYFISELVASLTGEGNGNLLHYSCLKNPMYKGAWQATVHRLLRVGHNWSDLAAAAAAASLKKGRLYDPYKKTFDINMLSVLCRNTDYYFWFMIFSHFLNLYKFSDTDQATSSVLCFPGKLCHLSFFLPCV